MVKNIEHVAEDGRRGSGGQERAGRDNGGGGISSGCQETRQNVDLHQLENKLMLKTVVDVERSALQNACEGGGGQKRRGVASGEVEWRSWEVMTSGWSVSPVGNVR